jgi:outer membrane protein assembly factor BamB
VGCSFLKIAGGLDLTMLGTYDLSADNSFYGINLADGSVAWSFDNGGGADGIGPIAAGCSIHRRTNGPRVFFASRRKADGSQDSAWALDFTSASATKAWSVDIGDVDTSASGRPPGFVCPEGCMYLGNDAGEVHKLNAETGAPEWLSPYFTNDGPVKDFVFPDFTTRLATFSTDTSTHLLTDDGDSFSSVWLPPVELESPSGTTFFHSSDGNYRVYVGDGDGRVYELDATVPNPPKDTSILLGDPAREKQPGGVLFDNRVSPQMTFWGTDESVVYAFPFPLP